MVRKEAATLSTLAMPFLLGRPGLSRNTLMSIPPNRLPDEVVAALRRGDAIGAVNLLRQSHGLGLKEARAAIDSLRGHHASNNAQRPAAGATPVAVISALKSGQKIEAIRLYRQHAGVGLKEAKDAVDAFEQGLAPRAGALSPGDVPRTHRHRIGVWLVVALLVGWWLMKGWPHSV